MYKQIRIGIEKNEKIFKVLSLYVSRKDNSFKIDVPRTKDDLTAILRLESDRNSGLRRSSLADSYHSSSRPQLSIHESGFVQFSGKGIRSGRDKETKQIKGVGLETTPLSKFIPSGPIAIVQVWGLESGFDEANYSEFDYVYKEEDFVKSIKYSGADANIYSFEIWIFNEQILKNAYLKDNKEMVSIQIRHRLNPGIFPAQVIRLKSELFIGVLAFRTDSKMPFHNEYGYIISGPTERSKKDKNSRWSLHAMPQHIHVNKDSSISIDFPS